ncbi:MAG: arsenate-mycothiol transferase ArsC [Caulobacteraceae bacterium]
MTALPHAVLFACNLNKVRSPMAAALMRKRWGDRVFVDSCGLQEAEDIDPFAVAVMAELGLDLSHHVPKTFEALEDDAYDLVISLTLQAHERAADMASAAGAESLVWATPDPTLETGSREQRLASYRSVRDHLASLIDARFADHSLHDA